MGTGALMLPAHQVSEMSNGEILFLAVYLIGYPFGYPSYLPCVFFLAQQKAAHICDRNRLYKSHSKNIVVSVIV